MTTPRHLWSGDWRRESAAAARGLAERRVKHDEPTPAPEPPPPPPRPSAAARARARLERSRERAAERATRPPTPARPPAPARPPVDRPRTRSPRARRPAQARPGSRVVLVVLAVLVSAGIAYAAVSSLVGSDSGGSPPAAASAAAGPAWLGVDMGTFASAGGSSFPSIGGVVVTDVVPGGPAAAAGLEPGDLITQINNRQVGSPNDVDSTLAGMHPGQRVQIQYERGPFTDIAQVTLAPRPKGSP